MNKLYLKTLFLCLFSFVGMAKTFAYDIAVANADGVTIYYSYRYTSNGTELAVTYWNRYNADYSGSVIIPETVTYDGTSYNVTSIGDYAFYWCRGLTSVSLPNSLTSIEDHAFEDCSGLTSVSLPNSLTSIGNYAFYYCSDLTSVSIPNSVTSIGDHAFGWCRDLTSVSLPNSLTSIGNYAFYYCSDLTSVSIPNSVTSIGDYAFAECSSLIAVVIPESVTNIGENAFDGCSSLESVKIPGYITSIGESAFRGCINLTSLEFNAENCSSCGSLSYPAFPSSISSLTIGDKVTKIPDYFLYYGSEIESLVIPNSVTSIGTSAFRNSNSLKSVTLGLSVQTIGASAFSLSSGKIAKAFWLGNTPPSGYDNLNASIHYVANDQYSMSNRLKYQFLSSMFTVDGVVYVPVSPSDRTCDVVDCVYTDANADMTITGIVTNKGVEMSVVNINQYAFYNNNYLQSLNASNEGEISSYAFNGCAALKEVAIANTVTIVGDYAFSGCSSLSDILIEDAEEIEEEPMSQSFPDWTSTNHADSSTSEKEYSFEVKYGDVLTFNYSVDCEVGYDYLSVKIDGVQVLNESGKKSGSFRKEFDINKTVTLHMSYTKDASGSAGNDMASVTDILLCGSGNNGSLILGSNGKSPLFADCPLDKVYIGRMLLYNKDASCGTSPFYGNTSLKTVEIADAETRIYDKEFYGCTNLKSIKIGNGVTTIGEGAFYGCSSLDDFSAGYRVDSIGKDAFADCVKMTKYHSHSIVPPACGEQALDGINKWNCTLYVPAECSDEYSAASQWKDFFFVEEMEPVALTEICLDVTEVTLMADETIKLNVEFLPVNATDRALEWTSSDESVATVDENGEVVAVADGNAVITVRSKGGNAEATCNVRVYSSPVGVEAVYDDLSAPVEVFNLNGYKVTESVENLTKGVYIVKKGGKIYKKIVK